VHGSRFPASGLKRPVSKSLPRRSVIKGTPSQAAKTGPAIKGRSLRKLPGECSFFSDKLESKFQRQFKLWGISVPAGNPISRPFDRVSIFEAVSPFVEMNQVNDDPARATHGQSGRRLGPFRPGRMIIFSQPEQMHRLIGFIFHVP